MTSLDLFLKDDSPTKETTTIRADTVDSHNHHHHPDGSNPVSRQRIVVSLTTMPSRIPSIESTLTSLLTYQTMPLDKLYLVLPQTKWVLDKGKPMHYEIPEFLTNLTNTDDRLEILKAEYDYGPVDKMIYALTRESDMSPSTTNLIYVDDDVIYHKDLVRTLMTKGLEYPDSLVALSGCTLKSHFRQITHQFPRELYDKHPNLYYRLSGTESLPSDEVVDIVQGFAGVLVRPAFFDVAEFWEFVENVTLESNIWRSDDFIISAYLEHRNVTKWLVVGEAVHTIHKKAATKDNLGNGMHRNAMQAAYHLRSKQGVWSKFDFVDYRSLEERWRDLVDCEAGHDSYCKKAAKYAASDAYSTNSNSNSNHQTPDGGKIRSVTRGEATVLLDAYLLASPPPE